MTMVSTVESKPLGQLLVGSGLLKPAQLDLALQEQLRTDRQKLLGEILIEQKWCSPEQVAEALAQGYGVPFARITPRLADPKVIHLLPREFIERNVVLPLFKVEGALTVAVPEPTDVFLLEEMERLSGCRVNIVAATVQDIRATLKAYLPTDRTFAVDDLLEDLDAQKFALVNAPAKACGDRAAADPGVVKLARATLYAAAYEGATEIHIEPAEKEFRIRLRIDGRLVERRRLPSALHAPLVYRLKWMAELDPQQMRRPQDGLIRVLIDGRPLNLSLTTAPTRGGETLVLRIAQSDRAPLHLEKLGFAYDTFKQWRKLLSLPNGLILVTGPAGSGKRTTLYASLSEMNATELNLCTVEQSVETNLPGINQLQIDAGAGFGFAESVSALLRHGPDVLMIGDVRDSATARLAAQGALDGRLILAAASAADTSSAIAWLLNLGAEPFLLGATLAGVLAQRLVRKLCTACKEPYEPTAGERRQLDRHVGSVETLYKPKGCPRCRNLGYVGRIGVHELLVPDDHFRERLSQAAPLSELRDLARAARIKTLRTDGMEKVKAGITTLAEVHRTTV